MSKGQMVKNEKGFTLVEVMIAMTIGVAVLGAAVYTYTKQNKIIANENRETQTRGMVRLALDKMVTEIRRAGYGLPPGDSASGRASAGFWAATNTIIAFRANTDNLVTNLSLDCGAALNTVAKVYIESNANFATGDQVSIFSTRDLTLAERFTLTGVSNSDPTVECPSSLITNSDALDLSGNINQSYTPVSDSAAVVAHKYHDMFFMYNAGPQTITMFDDNGTTPTGDDVTTTIATNVTGVSFTYYDAAGTAFTFPLSGADVGNIRRVEIVVSVQDREDPTIVEAFSTDINLRNMGV